MGCTMPLVQMGSTGIFTYIRLLVVVIMFGLCAAKETIHVKVKAGGTASLHSNVSSLYGDYHALWSINNNKETLVNFENGMWQQDPPERFKGRVHVDKATGSINITNVTTDDGGTYFGEITNGNNNVYPINYTLTVLKADPVVKPDVITTPAPPPAAHRHHWTLALCFGIFLCVCLGLGLKGEC